MSLASIIRYFQHSGTAYRCGFEQEERHVTCYKDRHVQILKFSWMYYYAYGGQKIFEILVSQTRPKYSKDNHVHFNPSRVSILSCFHYLLYLQWQDKLSLLKELDMVRNIDASYQVSLLCWEMPLDCDGSGGLCILISSY